MNHGGRVRILNNIILCNSIRQHDVYTMQASGGGRAGDFAEDNQAWRRAEKFSIDVKYVTVVLVIFVGSNFRV